MKNLLFIIVFSVLLGFTPKALAQTSVDVSGNGEGASSEVHIENSFGEGGSMSTVCINGRCETSQGGNIDRQEGGVKVKIETPLRSSSFEGQDNSQAIPTPTVSPAQQKESSMSAKKTEVKEKTDQQFNLEQMLDSLHKWINDLFH